MAEFMEQVLTNPVSGYYMQPNVFGAQGDFVTSPDISQMFGEVRVRSGAASVEAHSKHIQSLKCNAGC